MDSIAIKDLLTGFQPRQKPYLSSGIWEQLDTCYMMLNPCSLLLVSKDEQRAAPHVPYVRPQSAIVRQNVNICAISVYFMTLDSGTTKINKHGRRLY